MTDRTQLVEVVTRLYTAAGRRYAEADLVVYAEALAQADGALVVEASKRIVAKVDLGIRPPSPRLLLEWVAVLEAEERARRPAIPSATGPVTTADKARQEIADARGRLHAAPAGDGSDS